MKLLSPILIDGVRYEVMKIPKGVMRISLETLEAEGWFSYYQDDFARHIQQVTQTHKNLIWLLRGFRFKVGKNERKRSYEPLREALVVRRHDVSVNNSIEILNGAYVKINTSPDVLLTTAYHRVRKLNLLLEPHD